MTKLAMLGDSVTQRGTASQETTNTYLSGYPETLLGPTKISAVYNHGVGGDTLAMMLARVGAVTATDADVVFLQGGGNDLLGADTPLETMKENFLRIASAVRKAGKKFIASTILDVSAGMTTEKRKRREKFNSFIKSLPRGDGALINYLIDFDLVDYSAARSVESADGLHPNTVGSIKLGKHLADEIGAFLTASGLSGYSVDSRYDESSCFGLDGTLNAGFSGHLADDWQAVLSGTLSSDIVVSPRYSNDGNMIVLNHSNLSITSGASVNAQVVKLLGGIAVTDGDKFYATATIAAENIEDIVGLALTVRLTDSATTEYLRAWDKTGFTAIDVLPPGLSLRLNTPVYQAVSGCTLDQIRLEILYKDGATAINGELAFGNAEIIKVQ